MSDTHPRRPTAGVTIAATAVATLVMAVWGFNNLTAPITDDASPSGNGTGDQCQPAGQPSVVRRGDVTVSVYNAGKKGGRAQDTLDLLENAGFAPGAVGNAAGSGITRVQVRTTRADDPEARLVALAFGRNTPIIVSADDLGPGIDVIIGDKFKRLDASARTSVTVRAGSTCS